MNNTPMDHSMADHSAMGHSMESHLQMNHSPMNHSEMAHSLMNHSEMDHSLMNHSEMDHSPMNHSMLSNSQGDPTPMNHGSAVHMGMSMTFHFGAKEKVLFDAWDIHGISTMLLSCVGIFFIAVVYEGIKYYRENLLWKTYNTLHYRAVDENAVPDSENHKTVVREVIRKESPRMFSQKHMVQTGLHIIQLTVSYLLMLIFMTYNVWLCLAVVAGSAAGYFLFGWKRTVVVDMSETCH